MVLQETALRSESQLEATRRSLMELDEDKQAGKEEADSARCSPFLLSYQFARPVTLLTCLLLCHMSGIAHLQRAQLQHSSCYVMAWQWRGLTIEAYIRADKTYTHQHSLAQMLKSLSRRCPCTVEARNFMLHVGCTSAAAL